MCLPKQRNLSRSNERLAPFCPNNPFSMKRLVFIVILLTPVFCFSQQDSIAPGVYSWKEPVRKKSKNFSSAVLFEGKTHDMEWLQMNANLLFPSKTKTKVDVPANEEQLLIIKSGKLIIWRDSSYPMSAGSVALFLPGETYSLQNEDKDDCVYYVMKYRSKAPADMERGTAAGGSLIKEWNKIEFKQNDKGGRRDFFERPTALCKRFEMHVTTLKGRLKSHDPHAHKAKEIILVINGKTEMQIGGKTYKGEAGSVYFLPSNILHGIRNDGEETCSYFAFQFE
jgi:(S)-ureidoglycine aminohydrolase